MLTSALVIHRAAISQNSCTPFSPDDIVQPDCPTFRESVKTDLIRPYLEHPFSDSLKEVILTTALEIDAGTIDSFAKLKKHVSVRDNWFFASLCNGAEALFACRKIQWVGQQIQQCAHRVVSGPCPGEAELSYQPLVDVEMAGTGEVAVPQAIFQALPGCLPAAATHFVHPTKKKQRLPRKSGRRTHSDSDVPLLTQDQVTRCPFCDKSFSGTFSDQKTNCQRHILSKHSGKVFTCPECSKIFARSDYLLNHRRKDHPMLC